MTQRPNNPRPNNPRPGTPGRQPQSRTPQPRAPQPRPQPPAPAPRSSSKPLIIGLIIGGGIAVLICVTGLLIHFLKPKLANLTGSRSMAQELSNRANCAANIRGIAQSMVLYSADNNDYYPYIAPGASSGIIAKPPTDATGGGVMYDLHFLVGVGMVKPQQFVCKSDPATITIANQPSALPRPAYPPYSPPYWTNPSGNPNLTYSYSFASPFAAPNFLGGWWKNSMDANLPIAADMNPGNFHLEGKPDFNSLNHLGDGQNVAFADAHAEFVRNSAIGENNDRIYSLNQQGVTAAPGTSGGTLSYPGPGGISQGSVDTWLVPGLTDINSYSRE